jgi:hypothetical protein
MTRSKTGYIDILEALPECSLIELMTILCAVNGLGMSEERMKRLSEAPKKPDPDDIFAIRRSQMQHALEHALKELKKPAGRRQ